MALENINNNLLIDIEPLPAKQSLSNDWLTPEQLQAELGITIRTQEIMRTKKRQLQDTNPLPFSKFGKSIFYNRARLQEWLMKNEVKVK